MHHLTLKMVGIKTEDYLKNFKKQNIKSMTFCAKEFDLKHHLTTGTNLVSNIK